MVEDTSLALIADDDIRVLDMTSSSGAASCLKPAIRNRERYNIQ
jgi:hypothetical protein